MEKKEAVFYRFTYMICLVCIFINSFSVIGEKCIKGVITVLFIPVSFQALQCCPSDWLHWLCCPRCHTEVAVPQSPLQPLDQRWYLCKRNVKQSQENTITYFICSFTKNQKNLYYKVRRTHSQDKLIVWLIVDFIQNVKHLNGVVCYCAKMVVNRFFGLKSRSTSII